MNFSDFWNSVDKLSSLITWANWGIAATLLITFAFTVIVIKTGNRKDELTGIEDLSKAEQIANLEHANLSLRGQVATLETNGASANKDLAGLQRSASDAKAAQQKVEIDLAKQQEKTTIAERSLLELQRRMGPRRISAEQRARLLGILKTGPKGKVSISCVSGDSEGQTFANEIAELLIASGWQIPDGVAQAMYSGRNPVGFGIVVRSAVGAPIYAAVLQRAFFSIGIPMEGRENPRFDEGAVEILVGNKPN
jgi:hypothetical protein